MLILSRKPGESIQISDNISVTVSEVKGGRVRLSIEAPKSVRVVRQEILAIELPLSGESMPDKEPAACC